MSDDAQNNTENQSLPKSEENLDKQRISFSVRLVSCLENKTKEFNKKNKSLIRAEQLKEIYVRGTLLDKQNANLNGLARVNMFLRMNEQNIVNAPFENLGKQKKLLELVLETDSLPTNLNHNVDISEAWTPQQEDVARAEKDIKKYNLNFNFNNVEELYLDSYQAIKLNWE